MVCQKSSAWSDAAAASMSSMEYLISFLTSSCTQLHHMSESMQANLLATSDKPQVSDGDISSDAWL